MQFAVVPRRIPKPLSYRLQCHSYSCYHYAEAFLELNKKKKTILKFRKRLGLIWILRTL